MSKRYDLHLHTRESPCSRNVPEEVVETAIKEGLDGIAITDHDTVVGAQRVEDVAPPDLDVVIGAEITTSQGHLLGLDITETPKIGVDPLTAIDIIHDQDGVAILAHPFDRLRQTYTRDLGAIATAVDGVEIKNSRCLRSVYNEKALSFAKKYDLSVTGGSDGHFLMEIGRASTVCDYSILQSIRENKTSVTGSDRYASGHVATKVHNFERTIRSVFSTNISNGER